MDGFQPVSRLTLGSKAAVSPAARVARRRRDEEQEDEPGRKDEHASDDTLDDDDGGDGLQHVDVLACNQIE